jgi:LysM repeat protein
MAIAALGSLLIYILSPTALLAAGAAGPQVTITSPKSGDTLSGVARVRVEVEPASQLKFVVFLIDDVLKGMTNVPPYSYRWITTQYLNGSHKLLARAFDLADRQGSSPILEVYVNNPVGPTQLLTPPQSPAAPASQPLRVVAIGALVSPRQGGPAASGPALAQAQPALIATPVLLLVRSVDRPGGPEALAVEAPSPPTAASRPAAASPVRIALLPRGEGRPGPAPSPVQLATPLPPTHPSSPPARASLETPTAPKLARNARAEGAPASSEVALISLPGLAPAPSAAPYRAPAAGPAAPLSAVGAAASARALPPTAVEPKEALLVAMLPRARPELPVAAPAPAPEPRPQTYTVQPGDSLWAIAHRLQIRVSSLVSANGLDEQKPLQIGQKLLLPSPAPELYADGKLLEADALPFIAQGISMAPFRTILEYRGAQVRWNPAARQASARTDRGDITVTIGSQQAQLDDKILLLARPAEIRSDRTFVPLRFLARALDLSLRFDPETQSLHLAAR